MRIDKTKRERRMKDVETDDRTMGTSNDSQCCHGCSQCNLPLKRFPPADSGHTQLHLLCTSCFARACEGEDGSGPLVFGETWVHDALKQSLQPGQ